jgi:hypothetical protein
MCKHTIICLFIQLLMGSGVMFSLGFLRIKPLPGAGVSCLLLRDQEDLGLKPAWTIGSQGPILKKPNTHTQKGAGGVAQGVDPEFKAQHHRKKKKKE